MTLPLSWKPGLSVLFHAQPLAVSAGECLSAVAGALSLLFHSFGLRFTSCVTNILFVAWQQELFKAIFFCQLLCGQLEGTQPASYPVIRSLSSRAVKKIAAGRALKLLCVRQPFVKQLSSAFLPRRLRGCSFPLPIKCLSVARHEQLGRDRVKIGKAGGIALVWGSSSQEPFACRAGGWLGRLRAGACCPPGSWAMNGMVKPAFYPLARRDWLAWKLTLSLQLSLKAPDCGLPAGNLRLWVKNGRGNSLVFLTFNISKKLGESSATDDFALLCSKFFH